MPGMIGAPRYLTYNRKPLLGRTQAQLQQVLVYPVTSRANFMLDIVIH